MAASKSGPWTPTHQDADVVEQLLQQRRPAAIAPDERRKVLGKRLAIACGIAAPEALNLHDKPDRPVPDWDIRDGARVVAVD
jgi:hypothetical protein